MHAARDEFIEPNGMDLKYPICVVLLITCASVVCFPAVALAAGIERHDADEQFQAELAAVANKCAELGLKEQELVSRQWFIMRDPRRHYLFLPTFSDPVKPPSNAPRLVKFWYDKFLRIRKQQADRLFAIARDLSTRGDEAAAFRLLHEVLHEYPDHAEARRILGYARGERGWRQATQRPSRRRNRGPHPQFGWASNQYWQVDSEHFELTTNVSARAGQQTATYLERVYAVWQQLFYAYWSVPGRLTSRFQGADRPLGPTPVFSVVLFNDRDEYVRQLSRSEPQIGMSVGYYLQDRKTAFFYAGDDTTRPTWVHESTHQFFHESGMVDPQVAERSNFWVIEGVALYMESLIDHQRYATTGGIDAERLQFARFRKLSEGYYVPLGQLVGYGRRQMQQDENIRRLYSQSAGLTHFMMHGADGQWMEPFVSYVKKVYRGTGQHDALQQELGQPYVDLDHRYPQFLNVTDADLPFVDPGVQSLCLGHTDVTDAGLVKTPACSELQWLDLSFTSVSDTGIAHFGQARELDQLNLEKTRISDVALDTIARFQKLAELDLSQTAVTDQGLKRLSRLSRLRVLWLTATQVTDQGLVSLTSLRNLEQLDVQGTRVTRAALEQLRKRLPKLK